MLICGWEGWLGGFLETRQGQQVQEITVSCIGGGSNSSSQYLGGFLSHRRVLLLGLAFYGDPDILAQYYWQKGFTKNEGSSSCVSLLGTLPGWNTSHNMPVFSSIPQTKTRVSIAVGDEQYEEYEARGRG